MSAVAVLKVPDLTTSVVTRTLTALIVDIRQDPATVTARRLLSWLSILAGAVTGAILVRHAGVAGTLAVVLAVQLVVVALLGRAARRPAAWQRTTASAG